MFLFLQKLIYSLMAVLIITPVVFAGEFDFVRQFSFSLENRETVTGLSSAEDVIQYGGSVTQIRHTQVPGEARSYVLGAIVVEKTNTGRASTNLGKIAILVDGKAYRRIDDVFLTKHSYERLPGYKVQMGGQRGYACFEIPAGINTETVSLLSGADNLALSLNGVPIVFKDSLLSDSGCYFVSAAELAALLCARLTARPDGNMEMLFPDGKKLLHTVGDDKYTIDDREERGGGKTFLCDGIPYIQASVVLKAIGAVLDKSGSYEQPLAFSFTDLRMAAQSKIRDDIRAAFAAGDYDLDNPLVIQDPYRISPLSALVMFRTAEDTTVSVKVAGRGGNAALIHEFQVLAKEHAVPVLGLYPAHNNEVTISARNASGEVKQTTLRVTTDHLPNDFSKFNITTSIPKKMAPGFTFVDCPHLNGNYPFAIDATGTPRWYLSDKQLNAGLMLTHLRNGNMIVGSGMFIPNSYNNLMAAYEITPLGKIVRIYNIYGLHHDVRETRNGNLIFMTSKAGRESLNDYIEEVDRQTGKTLREWDLMKIVKLNEYTTRSPYSGGLFNWLHHNAVSLDESKGEILISGRHQDLILNFDATTGEVKWWFSGSLEKLDDEMEKTRLEPSSSSADFEYPKSQHAAFLLPGGRVMLFDNRNDGAPNDDGTLDQNSLYSRAVVYEVDPIQRELVEVWQFGKGKRSRELYSSFASDVDYLGENHYLIDFGGQYKSENGENYDHMFTPAKIKFSSIRTSQVIELVNDEIVFDVLVHGNENSNSYKVERKELYAGVEEESIAK